MESAEVSRWPQFTRPVEFDAEPVQPGNAMGMQGADDEINCGGGLSAAYRAEPDDWFDGEVDSGVLVGIGAAKVIADSPTLQDGNDRQARIGMAQGEHAGDGATLMFSDGQAGFGNDGGFAHPVLGRGPGQVADLIAVPADLGGILAGQPGRDPRCRTGTIR